MTLLNDPIAEGVLSELHRQDQQQFWSIVMHFLPAVARRLLLRKNFNLKDRDATFLRDKLAAIDRAKGELAYSFCRALQAHRAVEVGTSFGVSTIYLAAAIRDNAATSAVPGQVIGSEIETEKVRAARANIERAGLTDFVEIREGDALEKLRDCGGPVDFLLLDTWIPLVRPAIELIAPQLRSGAIVLCDNVKQFEKEYRDFTDYVRHPANGFRSMLWPGQGGLEISVKA